MNPAEIPLRDLHLPDPVSWWPLAPGWWLLLAIALAGLLWLASRAYRDWQRGRARRLALRELDRLAAAHAADGNVAQLAKSLSALLRRAMLAYAPRVEVARLTGDAWLNWLDRGLAQPVFTEGPGSSLGWLPYRAPRTDGEQVDVAALIKAVRLRLATPLPEETR
ncbi:MAG: DUF4381 domain-containing protein [Woeseia sp.]